MVELRVVGLIVAVSHLFRSFFWPDHSQTLLVEIHQFRAEIAKAELTVTKTSAVLEHCTTYSNFLTWAIKFIALSELGLCIWILYLLVWGPRVPSTPISAICDRSPSSDTSADSPKLPREIITGPEVVAPPVRLGPVRPSDLKKSI